MEAAPIARSATGVTGVVTLAVLFDETVSASLPVTPAVATTEGGAAAVGVTMIDTVAVAPEARFPMLVVSVPLENVGALPVSVFAEM